MNEILHPIEQYNSEFKEKHLALTEECFDKLVQESGVDVEANAELMSERRKLLSKLHVAQSNLRKHKNTRGWLIFLVVLMFVAALVTAYLFYNNNQGLFFLAILLPAVAVCGAIALIVVIAKVINNRIRHGNGVVDELKKQINEVENKGWQQLLPLNVKYDWNIPDKLIYQTVPQIQLDKYFDEDKHDYFINSVGLSVAGRNDISVCCARSGNSCGNPFLLIRYFVRKIVQHTYTGTLTVSWTEHYTDSEGKSHIRHETQTLVATVTKPKPVYSYTTRLYYGNDAAPDLQFSRAPVVPKDASDKKIASIIRSGERRLEKKTREAVKNGKHFNMLANTEFEVLFGAENRTHETQFRLMFTPLAQQNMVKLLRNKEPYGDDFNFEKNGRVNTIYSSHSADLDIDANPDQFVSFDLQAARNNFINFNVNYFASLYFDFVPLFSIPIYQQERPQHPYGECTKHSNIGNYEMESVANYFREDVLAPPDATTQQILKAAPVFADDNGTVAEITSYAYRGEDRVDYIPEMARNGRVYNVPVHWVEYIPVERTSRVQMQAVSTTREQYLTNGVEGKTTVLVGGVKATLIED